MKKFYAIVRDNLDSWNRGSYDKAEALKYAKALKHPFNTIRLATVLEFGECRVLEKMEAIEMKKSTLQGIPAKAEVEAERFTDGLAVEDQRYERHALFKYRGYMYYYLQAYDINRGFYKDVYLLDGNEYEKELDYMKRHKWNAKEKCWMTA